MEEVVRIRATETTVEKRQFWNLLERDIKLTTAILIVKMMIMTMNRLFPSILKLDRQ
jgi:hypothetical protein